MLSCNHNSDTKYVSWKGTNSAICINYSKIAKYLRSDPNYRHEMNKLSMSRPYFNTNICVIKFFVTNYLYDWTYAIQKHLRFLEITTRSPTVS